MLRITDQITIPDSELDITAVRAGGPGGQNVNKVSTAIHLRFDIRHSRALPDDIKQRLLALSDRRITPDGIVIIKARRSRSQDQNRADALQRLAELVGRALAVAKPRRKTRPGRKATEKRLADKAHRAKLKKARASLDD